MAVSTASYRLAFLSALSMLAAMSELLGTGPLDAKQQKRCEPVRARDGNFQVQYYVADLKPSFPLHKNFSEKTRIDDRNYRLVLDGLKNNVGVNGLRLPIFPSIYKASDYSSLYKNLYAYARQQGFMIYASPMAVGWDNFADWSDQRYVVWLADYVDTFKPDVLSPLNEAGLSNTRMASLIIMLRAAINEKVLLAGPDRQHLGITLKSLNARPYVLEMFDIIDSHSANRDETASAENWARLKKGIGDKPVWSSENPTEWAHGRSDDIPGIEEAVKGGVKAIVVWQAKPALVDDEGQPSAKACEIASHLTLKHSEAK